MRKPSINRFHLLRTSFCSVSSPLSSYFTRNPFILTLFHYLSLPKTLGLLAPHSISASSNTASLNTFSFSDSSTDYLLYDDNHISFGLFSNLHSYQFIWVTGKIRWDARMLCKWDTSAGSKLCTAHRPKPQTEDLLTSSIK